METEHVWVTKDRRVLRIQEMSTEHIENAIAMCYRNGYISKETFDLYMFGPRPTGDMAEYYFEQELDRVTSRPILRSLGWLEEELNRRKGNGQYKDNQGTYV